MLHRERVGEHATASFPRAAPGERAGAVLARLAAERPACMELVLATDEQGRLAGALPLERLVAAPPETPVSALMDPRFPRVAEHDDQERAASLALHRQVDALPVTDAAGRPVGVMPSQALLQVLRREHVEDLHRLAGIARESARARHAIEDPPRRRVRHRLPWLLVGLAGSAVATAAMAAMQARLEANVAIAFFVPALVYLADAIGTQAETVAVRGLSLTRAGIGPLLAGEIGTGAIIGSILGSLAFPAVWLYLGDPRLALAVAASILVAGTAASAIGLLLPWVLDRAGLDPAYGTGPAGTVLGDIGTILIYFAMVGALA